MPETLTRLARRARSAAHDARTAGGRQALRREYAFEALGRFSSTVGVRTADGLIFVDTSDKTVGRSVYVNGQWDPDGLPHALEVAAHHGHEPRGVWVEVGANIGTTTLQAAKRFDRCIVVEPAPRNLELLRANIAANGHGDRVEVVAAVASAQAGSVRLGLSAKNHGDHRVSSDGIEVAAVRLDDVLDEHGVGEVGLMWIDTQGHEAQVLAGATRLLERPPVTVAEYWPPGLGDDAAALNDALSAWSTVIDLATDEVVQVADLTARYEHGQGDLLLLP